MKRQGRRRHSRRAPARDHRKPPPLTASQASPASISADPGSALQSGDAPVSRDCDSAHLREFALAAFTERPEVVHIQTHLIFDFHRNTELPVQP